VVEFWLPLIFERDVRQYADIALAAERIGFTGIALPDHVAIPRDFEPSHPGAGDPFTVSVDHVDPFTTITAMATATTTLRFMTYVYVLTMRDPFTVAKQAGSVSTLTGGRFGFGCGAGWLVEEIALLGHDPRTRGARMDEMLDVIQGFWRYGTFEYHGEHYDFPPATMTPTPQPPPPLWIGGGRASLRRAARFDGWVGMDHPLDVLVDLLADLEELRQRHADEHGPAPVEPQTMAAVRETPSRDLHARLEDLGVTATIALPWTPGDPSYATVTAKVEAMETWGDAFMR
jgi:probable F420-dependent oxidoreductase